jgi:hypothetical protein
MKRLFRAVAGLAICVLFTSGCGSLRSAAPTARQDVAGESAAPPLARTDPEHTYALLLNGGGRREINYQSHLIHLKQIVELLRETGIEGDKVAIFSGDGEGADADLATREVAEESALWLLPRGVGGLRPEIVYVNSEIDGFVLQPARKQFIREWFATTGKQL